eukprot:1149234-Pelagomonas_calceolata.AAC.12
MDIIATGTPMETCMVSRVRLPAHLNLWTCTRPPPYPACTPPSLAHRGFGACMVVMCTNALEM